MTRQNLKTFLLRITTIFSLFILTGLYVEAGAQSVEAAAVKLTKCSVYPIQNPVTDALAAEAQGIFIGISDGSVQALDSNISSGVWRTELGGEIVSNIVAAETGMLVVSNPVRTAESIPTESVLRSLSKETGVANWTARLPFSERFFMGAVQGNIAVVSREGLIASVDVQTGRILWRTLPFGPITARPTFSAHGIAFGTREKQIFIVAPETGEIHFKGTTDFIPTAITNPTLESMVVGDERGNVASVGIPGGKNIWKFKSGAAISFVSVSREGLFITSLDNFVYLISMYNGDVVWKRRLPGRVTEGLLFVNGYVVALIYGENSVFLIDTKKGKIIDQLPESERTFVNQVPLLVGETNLLITTPNSIEMYATNGCLQKIGKAASAMPPSRKTKIRAQ